MWTQSLLPLALFILPIVTAAPKQSRPISAPAPIKTVTIGNDKYSYESLVGKGEFPADARDKFGDTAGGWGSAIAADVKSWKQNKDGSYEGTIYAVPDRGWNTNGVLYIENHLICAGTIDFQARVHKFDVVFTPYFGNTSVAGDQLIWNYVDTLLLYDNRGVATTGLAPASFSSNVQVGCSLHHSCSGWLPRLTSRED